MVVPILGTLLLPGTHNGLPLSRERRENRFAKATHRNAPLVGLQRLVMPSLDLGFPGRDRS